MQQLPFSFLIFMFVLSTSDLFSALFLRDQLQEAHAGDYVITAHRKNYTLLHIRDRSPNELTIEEISIPAARVPTPPFSWKNWVSQGAPGNTSWVMYRIFLPSGQIGSAFSVANKCWYKMSGDEASFPTLLNLPFTYLSASVRKKIAAASENGVFSGDQTSWQPRLVVEGQVVPGVSFDAWRGHWPNDGSELSGRTIDVYLPVDRDRYPAYFPYWLQVKGAVGRATIRVIDSGSQLHSPAPPLPQEP